MKVFKHLFTLVIFVSLIACSAINVPFAVIENVPIYPGCESAGNNAAKKKCMSSKIQKFVQKKFNTDLASDLGLEGIQQIYVQFKIDRTGNITNVQARAPHPKLKQEAIKTIKALPKMTPGKQRGQAVGVLYSLPIRFQIEN
ncbi:MAG: energy transducer TonB [Flavobacteriales bacterium]